MENLEDVKKMIQAGVSSIQSLEERAAFKEMFSWRSGKPMKRCIWI